MLVVDPWDWLTKDGHFLVDNPRLYRRMLRIARFIEYGGQLARPELETVVAEELQGNPGAATQVDVSGNSSVAVNWTVFPGATMAVAGESVATTMLRESTVTVVAAVTPWNTAVTSVSPIPTGVRTPVHAPTVATGGESVDQVDSIVTSLVVSSEYVAVAWS